MFEEKTMDDIAEKMNREKTISTTEEMEVTIVYESPFISLINENKSVPQSDYNNLKDKDQTEISGTDKHVNDITKDSDNDNNNLQNTDIETISGNTNDFDNHSPTTHSDETLSHKIPEKCNKTISSLSAIAVEYYSDTDTEENSCIDTNKHCELSKSDSNNSIKVLYQGSKNEYRTREEESSSTGDNDSDSDSDSDSSDSSDSSIIVTSNDSDDSSETNRNIKKNKKEPKELRSELDDLPPIEDLKISVSEDSCDPMGEVAWTVEQLVVVRPKVGKPTLNLDTVLFIDKGKRALGKIFDVFGQVADPHYCVRFNSSEHIKESEIKVGMTVYYCPNTPYTSLIFMHELTKMKASDAVGADEVPDFSDDEEERQYYENLRQKEVNEVINTEQNIPQKRRRKSTSAWQSNHPWNRNTVTQNYKGRNSAKSNSHNSWSWSLPLHHNSSNYSPHFQQMHPVNSGLYGYMPYSDNSYVNSRNQDPNNSNNYNFSPQCSNFSKNQLPVLSTDFPLGLAPRFQTQLPSCVNKHNTLPSPNTRFPHANMYWQSQPSDVPSPWSLLSPPPPPPAEENHDTLQ